jgi:cyclophilin family peptidyl-prolyl cis-trans isomerase
MAARGVTGLDRSETVSALLDQLGPLGQLDRQRRRDAAFALSRIRARSLSPELQRALVEAALGEADADAQAMLVRAVGALGLPSPTAAQARDQDRVFAVSAVDPDVGVRVATARAAGPAGWPGVARMINDPSLQVRLEALSAVGLVRSLDRAALLRPVVEAGDDIRDEEEFKSVRALRVVEATAALDALAGSGALASTAPWLDPARPIRIREAAIRHTDHRPTLSTLATDDGDGPVRVAAVTRLMELNPRVEEVLPLLGAFDSMVAAVAMEWLVGKAEPAVEAKVIATMKATEEPDLLLSGTKVLIGLYSGEKPKVKEPAPAAKLLLPALHASRSAPVRSAGAGLAALLKAPAPPPWHHLVSAPLHEVLEARTARIRTSQGEVIVELFPEEAPVTVWTWSELARAGYFDGMKFHRVVPDFVVQGGDPRGDGSGGPGWTIPDELSPQPFTEGVLGMALSGPETGGSQWFITLSPQRHLDGGYTAFGRVVSGMHIVHSLVPGDVIERVRVDPAPARATLPAAPAPPAAGR